MTFLPSADAEELRSSVGKFLEVHAGRERLRRRSETATGYDEQLWRRGVDELGLTGLLTPESAGGLGVDLLTAGVLFEELGRALVCAPFLSTVALATPALLRACPPDVAAPLLEAVTAGTVATLAWTGARPSLTDLAWDGRTLRGEAPLVLDGCEADLLLVAARAGNGVVLLRVDPDADGLTRRARTTLDTTRRIGRLAFDGVAAAVLAEDAGDALDAALCVATLLLGAEQVGGAQRALDLAVGYARSRIQFGRPIGSFQAVKHRCADMLIDVELARSLVYSALHAVDADPAAAEVEAALVRGFVSDAYLAVASGTIQVHGGIGFTWEHDAHLYLKRARASHALFGTPTAHRRRAAELLGVTP